MSLDFKRITAAQDALLNVPFTPSGWEDALRQMAEATGSTRTQLVAFGGPSVVPFNCTNDVPADFVSRFVEIEGGAADVNWRIACAGAPFEIARESDYVAAGKSIRRGDYGDFVNQFDIPFGCQTVLMRRPGLMLGLACLRTRADGWTTPEDCEAFAALAPYVLNAVKIRLAIAEEGSLLLSNSLDRMGSISLVLDGFGLVGIVSAAADRFMGETQLLHLRHGHLVASHPEDDRTLQHAIADILSGTRLSADLWLVDREQPDASVACQLFALPRDDFNFAFTPRLLITLRPRRPLDSGQAQTLVELFGLTGAEAQVAIMAANGLPRERIADIRGSSVSTVNEQFKSLFRKLDVSREAELVAHVNQILR